MRYLLKRKSDSQFYRGREFGRNNRWTPDMNKAFVHQTRASASSGHTWSREIKCDCVFKPGTPYYKKRCKPTCALTVECKRLFAEKFEVIPVELRPVL